MGELFNFETEGRGSWVRIRFSQQDKQLEFLFSVRAD